MAVDNYLIGDKLLNQTIIKVNGVQVIFNTDHATFINLKDDSLLQDYVKAVIKADLLTSKMIDPKTGITTLERLDSYDPNVAVITLDISKESDGLEELQCFLPDKYDTRQNYENGIQANRIVPGKCVDDYFLPEKHIRWTRQMVMQLVNLRREIDCEFKKTNKKYHLWEIIASTLNSNLQITSVTGKDCDDKWRNLVSQYRKNLEKIKLTGDHTSSWSYFDLMDLVMKGTDELKVGMQEISTVDTNISEPCETTVCPVVETDLKTVDPNKSIITTQKADYSKRKWSSNMILILIALRKQHGGRFRHYNEEYNDEDNECNYLWNMIADKMNEKFKCMDFTGKEINSVWIYCLKMYESCLIDLKSGCPVKFHFFAVMDELLGHFSEIEGFHPPRPGEHLIERFNKILLSDITLWSKSSVSTDDPDSDSSGMINIWNTSMTSTLILVRKEIEKEIECGIIKKNRIWNVVASRFNCRTGLSIHAKDAENKWVNLKRTYQNNLSRLKKTGHVKWKHFTQLREILGDSVFKSNLYPVPKCDKYLNINESKLPITHFEEIDQKVSKKLIKEHYVENIIQDEYNEYKFSNYDNNSNILDTSNKRYINDEPETNLSSKKICTNGLQFSANPPDWFLEYVIQKESQDNLKYKMVTNLLNEIQKNQKQTEFLLAQVMSKLPVSNT